MRIFSITSALALLLVFSSHGLAEVDSADKFTFAFNSPLVTSCTKYVHGEFTLSTADLCQNLNLKMKDKALAFFSADKDLNAVRIQEIGANTVEILEVDATGSPSAGLDGEKGKLNATYKNRKNETLVSALCETRLKTNSHVRDLDCTAVTPKSCDYWHTEVAKIPKDSDVDSLKNSLLQSFERQVAQELSEKNMELRRSLSHAFEDFTSASKEMMVNNMPPLTLTLNAPTPKNQGTSQNQVMMKHIGFLCAHLARDPKAQKKASTKFQIGSFTQKNSAVATTPMQTAAPTTSGSK